MIFTIFSKQISEDPLNLCFLSLQAIHIQNLSNRCRHKYDHVNFTNFSNLTFCRVFEVWPNCALEVPLLIFPAFVSNLRRPRPSFFFSQSLWQRPLLGYGRFWHYHIWNLRKKKIRHNYWLRIRVWWVVWNVIRIYKFYHQKWRDWY